MNKQPHLLLAVIATGILSFAGVLVETAMNVTFPQLISQFNITTSTVQWVTTAYLLVISIMVPFANFLLKNYRLRTLFIFANLIFIAGLIIDFIAPTFMVLIIGRIFQGISTGIALPLMFHIILNFSPVAKRGVMMGIATLTTAIAPAIGPTYGGLLSAILSWHYIFLFLVPVLVFSLILGILTLPDNQIKNSTKLDWWHILSTVLLFSGLLIFLNQLNSWKSLLPLSIGILGLILFIYRAKKSSNPLVKLKVLSNKTYFIGLIGFLACHFLLLGLSFVLPNFVQIVLDKSALIAGLVMLPGATIGALLAPIAGRVLDTHGPKRPILFGLACAIVGLSALLISIPFQNILLIIVAYFILQIGTGFAYSNLMTIGMSSIKPHDYGDANTLYNTMQQFAGAFIITIVATIIGLNQSSHANNILGTVVGSQWSIIILLGYLIIIFGLVYRYFKK